MNAAINHDEYVLAVTHFESMGASVKHLLHMLLESESIKTREVQFRVKSRESALSKVELHPDKYSSIGDLTDLLGLRITTYFSADVDRIAQLFESEFEIDHDNSVDKRKIIAADQFGYLSVHYIARLSADRTKHVEYKPYQGLRFELQIRSVLQDAWAEIEHDLGYKSDATLPREFRRRFSRVAGLLEIADSEFAGLRTELATHVSEVEARIDQDEGAEDLELDQATVAALIENDEDIRESDIQIARALNSELATEVSGRYAAARAKALNHERINSIGELRTSLSERIPLLEAFATRWLQAIPVTAEGRTIPRGITLFYLQLSVLAELPIKDLITIDRFVNHPEIAQLLADTWTSIQPATDS